MNRDLRWRLILGAPAEPELPLEKSGADRMIAEIDRSLSFVYDKEDGGASLDSSRPHVPENLADRLLKIRELFPAETVAMLQRDAIERRRIPLEADALLPLDRNLELVKLLLAAKDAIPESAKDLAREIVREVAAEIRRRLVGEVRQAVVGALHRDRHPAHRNAANVDWRRTIDRNLKNWIPDRGLLIPERIHFRSRQLRRREWDVVLLVDQSASMAESVIYSSIFASILASLGVARTHLILFDTSVVDMTAHVNDPVEILLGARLGGGTDIGRAVEYGSSRIEKPERTLFILVSDLREGGDRERLLRRLRALVESRVKTLCVLALTDDGRAAYDEETARAVAELGIAAVACTPREFARMLEAALR